MTLRLTIRTGRQGLHDITRALQQEIAETGVSEGLCTLFIPHTSASLIVQENADPSARRDLEAWMNRFVEENDPLYTHTVEGPDDMPAHIRAALTAVSISIPVIDSRLALGTWQGVYLWEHRKHIAERELILHLA